MQVLSNSNSEFDSLRIRKFLQQSLVDLLS
jgi:hypothetical protein